MFPSKFGRDLAEALNHVHAAFVFRVIYMQPNAVYNLMRRIIELEKIGDWNLPPAAVWVIDHVA